MHSENGVWLKQMTVSCRHTSSIYTYCAVLCILLFTSITLLRVSSLPGFQTLILYTFVQLSTTNESATLFTMAKSATEVDEVPQFVFDYGNAT